MGDVHLLGMIGAFFGWTGVFFSLFAASVFAIIAAVIGRIGFGKQLPFGPFLAMGAVTWVFGGWRIWAWYLDFLGPIGIPITLDRMSEQPQGSWSDSKAWRGRSCTTARRAAN